MTRVEALKAELAEIERQDVFYWQTRDPDRHEKLEYQLRRDKRREVITELLNMMERSVNAGYNSGLPLEGLVQMGVVSFRCAEVLVVDGVTVGSPGALRIIVMIFSFARPLPTHTPCIGVPRSIKMWPCC